MGRPFGVDRHGGGPIPERPHTTVEPHLDGIPARSAAHPNSIANTPNSVANTRRKGRTPNNDSARLMICATQAGLPDGRRQGERRRSLGETISGGREKTRQALAAVLESAEHEVAVVYDVSQLL